MLDPVPSVLPIIIVPLEGKAQKPKLEKLPDMRHWQIEEFLRQTGKADNTQRAYRGQLQRFVAWCNNGYDNDSCN